MAMSLVTSERGVAILPISIEHYLPPSIVSRRLKGEQPTIDLMIGYRKANASPILKTFLSRIDGLLGGSRTLGQMTRGLESRLRHAIVMRLV